MANQVLSPEIIKALEEMNKKQDEIVVPQVKRERKESVLGEKNQVTCSDCNKNQVRIFKKKFPSGLKQYVGEDGRQWKGRRCPDCVKVIHREYMRGFRGTKKTRV